MTSVLLLASLASPAHAQSTTLVINEIDYDQPGTDGSEFIELKNVSAAAINIDPYVIELVNGTGGGATIYQSVDLPNFSLAAGAHYVVCAVPAQTPNCDLDIAPDSNLIQNGAPDAIGLRNAGALVDAVSYEGDTGAPYTEGTGTGLEDPGATGDDFIGISRFPDGVDTNQNATDLSRRCITPGLPNVLADATGCMAPTGMLPGTLVINEIDYDQPGTDEAEFIELKNVAAVAIDLADFRVEIVNGSGPVVAQTIVLPAFSLAPGGYYVICGQTANTPTCNLDVLPDSNLIMNGAPDAVALRQVSSGALIDTVSYEGDTGAPYTEGSGVGLEDVPVDYLGISRFPDGADTDVNNVDLSARCITPGDPNEAAATACPPPGPPRPAFAADGLALIISAEDGAECRGAGDFLSVTATITNTGPGAATGAVLTTNLTGGFVGVPGSCFVPGGVGSCQVAERTVTWTGPIPGAPDAPANVVTIVFQVRIAGGTAAGTDLCANGTLAFDEDLNGSLESMVKVGACVLADCPPTVDPNRQLGSQVHLPILDFQAQNDICDTWIEVQNIGPEFVKAALVVWGEPGFCPPQASGPLKVECTGLLKPGTTWNLLGAQIPSGAKGGILFKFTAKQLSTLGVDIGQDDITADYLCESLFFGVVGDPDDYRRFKKAYNEGLMFDGIPLDLAAGEGILAVDVHRTCPGDLTPGVKTTSLYNGIAGSHLGLYDPIYGGFGYHVPLIYAGKSGYDTVLYIQNGGLGCSSLELWFKAQDDCLRAKICDVSALAPGETYQFDASSCVGPEFQGSAWIRASQPMGVVVDIIGHDMLMTYVGEPQEINYTFDPERSITGSGNQVVFGPLIYSEYQGWDTGIQIQNLSGVVAAKVKVYFLDRSGDIITTLVDWICPRGSQTFFLPLIQNLPGNWVGSVRAESQEWFAPGSPSVLSPNIVGVATLVKYGDAARTSVLEALAYSLLPEHKVFDWQIGAHGGGLDSGVGLIALPSVLKDLTGSGMTSEIAIANVVPKPGFTDLVIYLYDQNGLIDYICQKLGSNQVEYIDLQTWGYVGGGFKGSAIISAWFWEHDVFDDTGFFLRNLVGLGAVAIQRRATRLGEDVAGDESAGERGIPFRETDVEGRELGFGFMGAVPLCPGFPDTFRPGAGECPDTVVATCTSCPMAIPDPGTITVQLRANIPATCIVEDVDLALDLPHAWIGDLDVHLVSPGVNSVRSLLFDDICGNVDNLDVLLDDDAAAPIGSVCTSPVAGVFTTKSGIGLDAFDGAQAAGDWVLQIEDDFAGSSGRLDGAELRLRLSK